MGYLLKGGTVITLDPASVERVDLRVEEEAVAARGSDLRPQPADEVIDVRGMLIMPGLVCAHTHLYSALARGMPGPLRAPANFREILELIWWRLDRAMDREAIYYSALVGALEAARAGTTCLFDHHSSPPYIKGSLGVIQEALEAVGLRGVLCYEITDRGGPGLRDQGLEETREWLDSIDQGLARAKSTPHKSGLFRGTVGAHASFTLADETLESCSALMRQYDTGLHIHVAEDPCDVQDARSRWGTGVVERLARHAALNHRTILAHGTHLDERDIRLALDAGAWFAHNPRSNMNNQVGYAPVAQFTGRLALGTDGIGNDMFEETRIAFFKARDACTTLSAPDWIQALARGQRMATQAFGVELGALGPGSAADLIVLSYDPPTPLTSENLAGHFIFGMGSNLVDSVMVGGRFIIRARRSGLDEQDLYRRARLATERLWLRLANANS